MPLLLHLTDVSLGQSPNLYPTPLVDRHEAQRRSDTRQITGSAVWPSEVTVHYPGITLDKVHRLDNGKYLALDITISPQAPASPNCSTGLWVLPKANTLRPWPAPRWA